MTNLILKLGAVIALFALLNSAWSNHSQNSQLKREGQTAAAILSGPIEEETQQRRFLGLMPKSTLFRADLKFKTTNGQETVVTHEIPKQHVEALRSGGPVNVVYLPSNPKITSFAGESLQVVSLVLAGLVFSALLFGLSLIGNKSEDG